MTKEQQKLIEDNHNLIYGVLKEYNLDREDWYDIAAIGLCKAAISYDNSIGEFSTLAYRYIHNEILHEYRRMSTTKRKSMKCLIYVNDSNFALE